jgi:two-component SAPR family response regulator
VHFNYLIIILLSILIGVAFLFIIIRKKYFVGTSVKQRKQMPAQKDGEIVPITSHFDSEQEEKPKPKSSINLFGQFQVFDKEGNDITVQFSPLQKELFLLIAINTISNKRGISPPELDHILWSGKSEKDAKNNRSVNITRLRAILDKIGNCTVARESGFWQFKIMDEQISLDYKRYSEIIESKKINSKEDIVTLIDIVRQGSFLYQTDYDWLDNIKSEVSNTIIGLFLEFMGNQKITDDPELIIKITNRIFDFDHLNEEALAYKCKALIILKRRTLANNIYLKFLKDYKDIYGTDFSKSFQEITD